MLEALFALCRKSVENEPLKIFMAHHRHRPRPRHAARSRPRWTAWRAPTATTAASSPSSANRAASATNPSTSSWMRRRPSTSIARPAVCARCRRARSRRWWGCGRSWCASRPFPDSQADAAFAGIAGAFLADPQRPRAVRRRPQRREAAAGGAASGPARRRGRRAAGADGRPAGGRARSRRRRCPRADGAGDRSASWKRSASFRWTRCSSWPISWRAAAHGEKLEHGAGEQAGRAASPRSSFRARR